MRLQRHTSFFSKIQTTTGWYLPKLCVVICLAPQEAPLHRWSGRKGPEAHKKWTKNHRTHTRIVQRSTKNRDHVITNHILSNEPENIIDHPVLSVLHLCDRFLVGSLSWCTQSSSGSTTKKPKETTCRGYPEQRSSAAFNSNKKISDTFWHRSQGNSPTKAHNLYNRNQDCWQAIGPAKFDVQELLLLLPNSDLSWLIAANQLIMAPWLICPASSSTSSEL